MTKENKFKIGLCLQGIALSMDDITLKANEDRLKMIEDIIAGEQEPCSDAQERYEDLCEYFGDAKDILKNRKDFKAWLERIKWHINKAEELYEKYECKEPCTDAVSRQAVKEQMIKYGFHAPDMTVTEFVEDLPSVTPKEPKTGHWIEKEDFNGDTYYDCSECGESFALIDGTPTDNLYNFCPNCGADMRGDAK